MRAEEGDECVKDYADEGKQTMNRIKGLRRPGSMVGDVARRFATLWRGDHASGGGGHEG